MTDLLGRKERLAELVGRRWDWRELVPALVVATGAALTVGFLAGLAVAWRVLVG